jgi:hypothetical protein
MLALSFAVVAATATVAVATPPHGTVIVATGIEDQNDRLLRNLEAGQAEGTQAAVEQARAMERDLTVTAAVPAPVEDQNDRLLRNLQVGQAEGTQAAVQLARAIERTVLPVVAAGDLAVRSAPAPAPRGVDVIATLLLGLAGGLLGGGAAIAGWAATARRRPQRAAAAV